LNWLQNLIVVVVCFLMARVLIDAGIHHHLVGRLISKSRATVSSLITGALLISYFLSMFFPNIIVLLSLIPIIKFILENIKEENIRKKISTPLALALIYGANIGGMGSLIGSPLNLVYVGYIEVSQVPGRENITFFSWLLIGIPATLVLIFISRWILKIGEVDGPIPFNHQEETFSQKIETRPMKKYVLFFGVNILFIILLTAAQFFFKPGKIFAALNIIDVILLVYLMGFLFFSFIFPQRGSSGKRTPLKYKKNSVFLLMFVVFFPLVYIIETLKEVRSRLKIKRWQWVQRVDDMLNRNFNRTWYTFFKEDFQDYLKSRNKNAFVSINRLIYDLPFMGLLFMGLVIVFVFLILTIGDNPQTPKLDGYIFQFFERLAADIIPQDNQSLFFLLGIAFISIFMTEFINNTTVVFIMFPLVLQMTVAAHLNPLFFLLAVSTAASGAFMTPVATPVNAIGYASIKGVSLKRMVKLGFILNIASALWVTGFLYLLNQWF
jgi:sodium-dependent dicarboxylate transporter 2/3/5